EDGIRDFHVTGVQTCALPILRLGRFENLRRVQYASHCDANSNTRWQISFNRPVTKPSFMPGLPPYPARNLPSRGFSRQRSSDRAWRLSTARSSTWRCRRCKGASTPRLSTSNGSLKPTRCCSHHSCSWAVRWEIITGAAAFSLLESRFFLS